MTLQCMKGLSRESGNLLTLSIEDSDEPFAKLHTHKYMYPHCASDAAALNMQSESVFHSESRVVW